jgi:hypothetical protein
MLVFFLSAFACNRFFNLACTLEFIFVSVVFFLWKMWVGVRLCQKKLRQ